MLLVCHQILAAFAFVFVVRKQSFGLENTPMHLRDKGSWYNSKAGRVHVL